MQIIFKIWLVIVGKFLQNWLSEIWKINISILPDEVSDCSNPEQLFLVIRHVDSDCVIREGFLGFLYCDLGFSDKALALGGLVNLLFGIRNCHGQGYDGAAVVSGHINRSSVHIW